MPRLIYNERIGQLAPPSGYYSYDSGQQGMQAAGAAKVSEWNQWQDSVPPDVNNAVAASILREEIVRTEAVRQKIDSECKAMKRKREVQEAESHATVTLTPKHIQP